MRSSDLCAAVGIKGDRADAAVVKERRWRRNKAALAGLQSVSMRRHLLASPLIAATRAYADWACEGQGLFGPARPVQHGEEGGAASGTVDDPVAMQREAVHRRQCRNGRAAMRQCGGLRVAPGNTVLDGADLMRRARDAQVQRVGVLRRGQVRPCAAREAQGAAPTPSRRLCSAHWSVRGSRTAMARRREAIASLAWPQGSAMTRSAPSQIIEQSAQCEMVDCDRISAESRLVPRLPAVEDSTVLQKHERLASGARRVWSLLWCASWPAR